MTFPMRFFLVQYADWDPNVWAYGLGVTNDEVVQAWERGVEHFCKLARDEQEYEIVPSLHVVKSSRPAAYWCLWDVANPAHIGPNGSTDIRGWIETAPDGTKTPIVDKRGQGVIESAILERLIPEEAGVPYSEAFYDTDAQHPNGNRVARWICTVVGGQGDTDIAHGGGGGGGGGVAAGAHRPATPEWPNRNYGFGVVGDWRLHFAVLARKLHGVDAADPLARVYLLDRTPDCRDRLMVKEYPEPRENGGFAGQHPWHSHSHEASHGCDIDIHNPDLSERPDGSFYYSAEQRVIFATRNAPFMQPIATPPPTPEPEPEPVRIISLEVPLSLRVLTGRTETAAVKAHYSDGRVTFVQPELWENSGKFSAAAMAGGFKVTAGNKPGDGSLVVRYGGVEKIVAVRVAKR